MRYSHFISGKWVKGEGEILTSTNPATGQVVWEGSEATKGEVDAAVVAARSAFFEWGRLPLDVRIGYVRQYELSLKAHREQLIQAISRETGKPLWEVKQEVSAMMAKVEISIDAIKERCPEQKKGENLYTHHKPHGVTAVFGPFNFPGHLPNGHIVPALLAGNTVVFKSSEYAPLVSETLFKCVDHFPEGVVNLVQGAAATGRFLASHPQIDGLFFTGSHQVGSLLAESFLHRPGKILALEMGGNNPLVVSEPGDLEAAAYQTIQSAYITSGQRCSCARRLIIPEGREGDEFLKVLTHMTASIQVGAPTDQPEPFMGPLISREIVDQLLDVQARCGSEGGKCLVEMTPLKKGLPFLSPGLMDVTEAHAQADQELFGPFLRVMRVPTFKAAIEEANKTEYGLTAALISTKREKYRQFYHEVRAGIINWNHPTTGASSYAPFGGIGKSGNFHPSGYYAADYCSYPVASMEQESLHLPKQLPPGVSLLAKS